MEQDWTKTGKSCADRISSLPEEIREHILTLLPLRDAVRASVLSTKWKNLWTQISTLVIDKTFLPTFHPILDLHRFTLNLCTVLMFHRGTSLREFSFSLPLLRTDPDLVDRVLHFLQAKHSIIDSLTLTAGNRLWFEEEENRFDDYYKLPRHLFFSSSSSSSSSSSAFFSRLKTLRLSFCEFVSTPFSTSPTPFERFDVLTVLELRNVRFGKYSFAPWSFRCSLLSALTLVNCSGFVEQPDIVIEAPKLSFFELDGEFGSLDLKHSPLLKTAIIRKQSYHVSSGDMDEEDDDDDDHHHHPSKLLQLWGALAVVESLSMSYNFYQWLTRDYNPKTTSLRPWEILRDMTLDEVRFRNGYDICYALRLVLQSPNLQRLVISMEENSDDTTMLRRSLVGSEVDVCKLQCLIKLNRNDDATELRRLKRVELKRLHVTAKEMAVIGWLLKSTPALDRMEIQLSTQPSAAEKMLFATKLNEFRRESNRARISVN